MTNQIIKFLDDFVANSVDIVHNHGVNRGNVHNVDDSGHIFYGLLQYISTILPNKASHTYNYTLSQKLLRVCRDKDANVATYFVQKIHERQELLSIDVPLDYHAQNSIFNPTLAYYNYFLKQDYKQAESHMLALLDNIDFLIIDGFRDGMFMKIEQYLNTSRVFFNAGDMSQSTKYAKEVIQYLLSTDAQSFEFPFGDLVSSKKQYYSILAIFFDGLLIKSLAKFYQDGFDSNRYLSGVFSNLNIAYNGMVSLEMKSAIEIFLLVLESNIQQAIPMILDSEVFSDDIPPSLRYLFLQTLLDYPGIDSSISSNTLDGITYYQNKVLNIQFPNKNIVAVDSTN